MHEVIELNSEKDFILFKNFLESINIGSDYYDLPFDYEYFYNWEFKNSDNIVYLLIEEGQCKAFTSVFKKPVDILNFLTEDFYYSYVYYCDWNITDDYNFRTKSLANHLISLYNPILFEWDVNLKDLIPEINKVNYKGEYGYINYSNYYNPKYIFGKNENYILKQFLEKFRKTKDIKDLIIKKMTNEELQKLLYDNENGYKIPTVRKPSGWVFLDFQYFSSGDLNPLYCSQNNFIVAIIDNEVVGVIKIGDYEDYIKYKSICYVDVSAKYRRKGIASKMIKELNNYLSKNQPLLLTDLSNDGKKARIDLIFIREIYSTKVYVRSDMEQMFKDYKKVV